MTNTTKGPTVLVLGGTGRTGRRVLGELLARGCAVRAIVRSRGALAPSVLDHPALTLLEGSLLSLGDRELQQAVGGCDAVVSCLGHVISVRGILGPPYRLVVRALQRVTAAIGLNRPTQPVRVILMSSVAVNDATEAVTRRGAHERFLLAVLRMLLPPARDNQQAADFLRETIGDAHPLVEWVIVRPDTLEEGPPGAYALHEHVVSSVFRPDHTRMANVAHFMAELATNTATWGRWKGRLPVIIDDTHAGDGSGHRPLDGRGGTPGLAEGPATDVVASG